MSHLGHSCVCVCVCVFPARPHGGVHNFWFAACLHWALYFRAPRHPKTRACFFFFFKVETERMFTYVQNSSESLQKNLVVIVAFGE